MRKLTNEELISVYFAINVYNEYFFNGLMFFKNTEYEINEAFGSPYKALKAVSDSYSVSEPYFYVLDEHTLISLTEDKLVNILRDNETEIVEIYESLVEKGDFEDFLNLAEDEMELTEDQGSESR